MIPKRLSPKDTIGIIAPSSAVHPELESRLTAGINLLESLDYSVKLGKYIHSHALGESATPEEKAADINAMFAAPDINAIICAQGGDSANSPLPLINWDVIKENPKIFMGLSDITVLLNAIYAQTDLVTFHGMDILWGLGRNPEKYEINEFTRVLVDGGTGQIPPNQPRQTIRGGNATGTLLGGNLRCLLKLAGTPFWPDFSDAIFFLEALAITPARCRSSFHQLKQMGVFNQIRGAIVGYVDSMQKDDAVGPLMESILAETTLEYNFPILKINDFGHNCPNTIMPVGASARMDADKQSIEILSPIVA
jgi:muramoyltetrapeptide carboxypeptidase